MQTQTTKKWSLYKTHGHKKQLPKTHTPQIIGHGKAVQLWVFMYMYICDILYKGSMLYFSI